MPFTSPSWNGSAWTLEYEFFCYLLLLPIFYLPFVRQHLKVFIPLAYLVSLSYYVLIQVLGYDWMTWALVSTLETSRLQHASTPSFCRVSTLPREPPYHAPSGNHSAPGYNLYSRRVLLHLARSSRQHYAVDSDCFTFGIIALGTCLNVPLGQTNDISYGVYIYALPVQQILVLLGSVSLGISVNIILDAIITFYLAWLSWTFVEKRYGSRP